MKKLLAILMCASLVFCASCGKKDAEVKEIEVETKKAGTNKGETNKVEKLEENPIETVVKDLDKVIEEGIDPEIAADVCLDGIDLIQQEADALAKELEDKVGKVPEDEIEEFQVQQVAVAILQQGLEALQKAQESGDEAAIEEAKQMIEMAKGMWDYQPEE